MIIYPLKLKYPPKIDNRTIPLKAIIKKELLPPLPDYFNVDESVGGINDNRIFGNDQYGNCAVAMKAHDILRKEKSEQGIQIYISDQEVIDQYFEETGGVDSGLYMLDTMKTWRKTGFPIGGRIYTIYAFASVDWRNYEEVKYCIYLLGGIDFGMYVYQTDMEQFNRGEPWHLTGNNGRLLGGHGVYGYRYGVPPLEPEPPEPEPPEPEPEPEPPEPEPEPPEPEPPPDPPSDCFIANSIVKGLNFGAKIVTLGKTHTYIPVPRRRLRIIGFDEDGLVCMTWGRRQPMSWEFWGARVVEAYGIVDNRDDWLEDSPVDVEKLDSYLREITK